MFRVAPNHFVIDLVLKWVLKYKIISLLMSNISAYRNSVSTFICYCTRCHRYLLDCVHSIWPRRFDCDKTQQTLKLYRELKAKLTIKVWTCVAKKGYSSAKHSHSSPFDSLIASRIHAANIIIKHLKCHFQAADRTSYPVRFRGSRHRLLSLASN